MEGKAYLKSDSPWGTVSATTPRAMHKHTPSVREKVSLLWLLSMQLLLLLLLLQKARAAILGIASKLSRLALQLVRSLVCIAVASFSAPAVTVFTSILLSVRVR